MPTLTQLGSLFNNYNNNSYNNYSNPNGYYDCGCDYGYGDGYNYGSGSGSGYYDDYSGYDGFDSFNQDLFNNMFGQGGYGSYGGGYGTGGYTGYGSGNPMQDMISSIFSWMTEAFGGMFGGGQQGYQQGGYYTPGYWYYPTQTNNGQFDYLEKMKNGQTFTVDLSNANLPAGALGKINAGDKTGKSVYQVKWNYDGTCTMQGYSNHSGQVITRTYPDPENCNIENGEFSICGRPMQIVPNSDGTYSVIDLQYGQIGTASFPA